MKIKKIIALIVGVLLIPTTLVWGKGEERVKRIGNENKEEVVDSVEKELPRAAILPRENVVHMESTDQDKEAQVSLQRNKAFYEIWNQADLREIEKDIQQGKRNGYYKLMKDITLEKGSLKTMKGYFNGTLDGDHHTIKGLEVPIFQQVGAAGQVKNLNIEANIVSDEPYIGGIATENLGLIQNIYIYGEIQSGGLYIGSIAGSNKGTIEYCTSLANINHARGSPGNNNRSESLGGLVGTNTGKMRYNCYIGSIESKRSINKVGGLVGINAGNIENSYVRGSIVNEALMTQDKAIGGLVGYNDVYTEGIPSLIKNCYFVGEVRGGLATKRQGAICGRNRKRIEQCYYDEELISQKAVGMEEGYSDVEALTSEEMKTALVERLNEDGEMGWIQLHNEKINRGYPVVGVGNIILTGGRIKVTSETAIQLDENKLDKLVIIDTNNKTSIIQDGLYIDEENLKNKEVVALSTLVKDQEGNQYYKATRALEGYALQVHITGEVAGQTESYIVVKKKGSEEYVKKKADDDGRYTFTLYEQGDYTVAIEIDKKLYQVVGDAKVEINVRRGEKSDVAFYLKEVPEVEEPGEGEPEEEEPGEGEPEEEEPGEGGPEVEEPGEGGPEVEEPEEDEPEEEEPGEGGPEVEVPEVGGPEVEVPGEDEPEVEVPEVGGPEVEVPEEDGTKVEVPQVGGAKVDAHTYTKNEQIRSRLDELYRENILKAISNTKQHLSQYMSPAATKIKSGLIPEFGLGFEVSLGDIPRGHWSYKEITALLNEMSEGDRKDEYSIKTEYISLPIKSTLSEIGLNLKVDKERVKAKTWSSLENNDAISREVFAQLIWELTDSKMPKVSSVLPNQDYEDSEYQDAIEYCIRSGILRGNNKGSINPKERITAEEAAVSLYRIMSKLKSI